MSEPQPLETRHCGRRTQESAWRKLRYMKRANFTVSMRNDCHEISIWNWNGAHFKTAFDFVHVVWFFSISSLPIALNIASGMKWPRPSKRAATTKQTARSQCGVRLTHKHIYRHLVLFGSGSRDDFGKCFNETFLQTHNSFVWIQSARAHSHTEYNIN